MESPTSPEKPWRKDVSKQLSSLKPSTDKTDVAQKLGVSRTAASRWYRQYIASVDRFVKSRKATGRPTRLNREQLAEVRVMLFRGDRGKRWTTQHFADAIEERFKVHYDQDHAGRIMHKLGWTGRVKKLSQGARV